MNDRALTRKARAGGRRRGGRSRERKQAVAPAFIKREIPFYEFLGEEGIVKLEDQADWIIQEIGLEFRDDPKALEIWKSAGADVNGTRVKLERGMARELCKTAPTEFTQHARNPERNVRIGGNSQVFAPVYGPPFVRDLEGGRRYGSFEDFENLVKIVSQLPSLHHSGLVIVEPCDLPVSKRHLDMVYAHMKYNDKPHLGAITEKSRAQDSVDMARILHGAAFMGHVDVVELLIEHGANKDAVNKAGDFGGAGLYPGRFAAHDGRDAAHHDLRLARRFHLHAFGHRIVDRVRETQRQVYGVALRLRAIAYAAQLELPLESLGYT